MLVEKLIDRKTETVESLLVRIGTSKSMEIEAAHGKRTEKRGFLSFFLKKKKKKSSVNISTIVMHLSQKELLFYI